MAIDTRNERAAALLYALPFARVFDNPDNAFPAEDRSQTALSFPGIPADNPTPGQPIRRRGMYTPGAWAQPGLFAPKVGT